MRFQQKTKSVFCCEAICVHKEGNIKEVTVSEIKWFWISHLIKNSSFLVTSNLAQESKKAKKVHSSYLKDIPSIYGDKGMFL